jgi:hypothetical protein
MTGAPFSVGTLIYSSSTYRKQEAVWRIIRHMQHRKLRVQQFLYFVCFLCREDVFTELSIGQIQTHKLVEVRRWVGLKNHDRRNKFHKIWFRHSNIAGGYTDSQRARLSHKPTFIYFKIRKLG